MWRNKEWCEIQHVFRAGNFKESYAEANDAVYALKCELYSKMIKQMAFTLIWCSIFSSLSYTICLFCKLLKILNYFAYLTY